MPKAPPKSVMALRKKMLKATPQEKVMLRQQINRSLRAAVFRGTMKQKNANKYRNMTLRRETKQLVKKKTKKLLKRASSVLGKRSESLELLRALTHFLSKAIDAYESVDTDPEDLDTLSMMFGQMAEVIFNYLEENEDARDPDYAELYDREYNKDENILDYMSQFHDYYKDRLKDYTKKPTEDKKIVLMGLTKELTSVLRKYSPEPDEEMPAAAPAAAANESGWGGTEAPEAPEAVRDELADLLSKMKM